MTENRSLKELHWRRFLNDFIKLNKRVIHSFIEFIWTHFNRWVSSTNRHQDERSLDLDIILSVHQHVHQQKKNKNGIDTCHAYAEDRTFIQENELLISNKIFAVVFSSNKNYGTFCFRNCLLTIITISCSENV